MTDREVELYEMIYEFLRMTPDELSGAKKAALTYARCKGNELVTKFLQCLFGLLEQQIKAD